MKAVAHSILEWARDIKMFCLVYWGENYFRREHWLSRIVFESKKRFWIKSNGQKLESNWDMRIPKPSKPQFLHIFIHAALSTSVWICIILCKSARSCVCLCAIVVVWPTECAVGLKSLSRLGTRPDKVWRIRGICLPRYVETLGKPFRIAKNLCWWFCFAGRSVWIPSANGNYLFLTRPCDDLQKAKREQRH